jgi:hypothetical protein
MVIAPVADNLNRERLDALGNVGGRQRASDLLAQEPIERDVERVVFLRWRAGGAARGDGALVMRSGVKRFTQHSVAPCHASNAAWLI